MTLLHKIRVIKKELLPYKESYFCFRTKQKSNNKRLMFYRGKISAQKAIKKHVFFLLQQVVKNQSHIHPPQILSYVLSGYKLFLSNFRAKKKIKKQRH